VDPSDPEDWFADADPENGRRPDTASEDDVPPLEDDWLGEAKVASRRPSWAEAIDRRVLVAAASFLVLLLAGLAAGGVFSGGRSSNAASLTTATAPTTAQTASTATRAAQQLLAPTTTLKPGDTGTQVATLQHALASLGFSPGNADGRFGRSTTDAVMRLQRKAGLTVDGIVGPATSGALVSALRGP